MNGAMRRRRVMVLGLDCANPRQPFGRLGALGSCGTRPSCGATVLDLGAVPVAICPVELRTS